MDELKALAFLNEMPYYFCSIGMGVELREKIGGVKVRVRKNNTKGGIDVFWKEDVFHFVFDVNTQKWGFPKSRVVSAS